MIKSILLIALTLGYINADANQAALDLINMQVSNAEIDELNVATFLENLVAEKDCKNSYFYSSTTTQEVIKKACKVKYAGGKLVHTIDKINIEYSPANIGANLWNINENTACQNDPILKFKCNKHPNVSVYVYAFKVVIAGDVEHYLALASEEQTRADSVIKIKMK